MSVLLDSALFSIYSLFGLAWTGLSFYLMFSSHGRRWLADPKIIVVAAIALGLMLWIVLAQIKLLTLMAAGIPPLDVQFGYSIADIAAFANALGLDGRLAYARFQLGQDTLAPPAFVCFLMCVYRSTVVSAMAKKVCDRLALAYFVAVLLANNLMPVMILNYPSTDGLLLSALYQLIPLCDAIKYSLHGATWLVIVAAWLRQLAARLHQDTPLERRSDR